MPDRPTPRWPGIVQRLIGAGHHYPDVMNFTLAQVNAFLDEIDRQESRRLANLLTVVSLGAQGSGDAIRKLLKGLDA